VTVAFLGGVALIALGAPPGASETGAQVVTWFSEHRNSVWLFVWALTVATPPIALVFAFLCRLLPAPHRDVFLIGAVTFVATTAVYAWTWAGLALHPDRLEPATARAIPDVVIFYGPVLTGDDRNDDGAGHAAGAARARRATPMAGRLGCSRFQRAGDRDGDDLWLDGLYPTGGAMNMQLGAGLTLGWILAFALWVASGGAHTIPLHSGCRR